MAKMDKSEVNGVSRSAWIRRQFIKNHNITVDQMQAAYVKTKYPKNKPITKQQWYSGKSQLIKRYGFGSWEKFPICARTKKTNVSGFIRFYLELNPDKTEADATEFMEKDGLKFHGGAFRNVRSKLKANPPAVVADSDEEPIQSSTEPRAGKPRRKYKKRGKKTGEDHPLLETYEGMEKGIEKLIAEAEALKNWRLVSDLKVARRRTSVAIVHFAD